MKLVIAALTLLIGTSDITHAVTEDSAVRALVYTDVSTNLFSRCIRLMTGTKQVGCQSSLQGNVGILFRVNKSDDVDKVLNGNHDPYVVLTHADYFDHKTIRKYKSSGKVNGVIVYADKTYTGREVGWSPEPKCPRYAYGLYSRSYGQRYANCSNWNKPGDALSEEDLDFPVFFMQSDNATKMMIECHNEHNLDGNYPFCAAQMKARMDGAVSTETCVRRNTLQNNLSPASYCDLMGGSTLISTLQATNSSDTSSSKPVILIMAAMDSKSFFIDSTVPGANSATGFITLLSIAQALGNMPKAEKDSMRYNIVFVLFDGEAYDSMGSMRMVYDMSRGSFPFEREADTFQPASFDLSQVAHVIEIGQLGHANGEVFIHFDPLSSASPSMIVKALQQSDDNFTSFKLQSLDIGLVPSSLQSILKDRNVSGVVITDFDKDYTDKHYFSVYDTPDKLGVIYDGNMTENEAVSQLMPLATKLANISTVITKAAYRLATDDTTNSPNIDVDRIAETLYCYYFNGSCQLFLDVGQKKSSATQSTIKRYVSVYYSTRIKNSAHMARNLLLQYIGENVPATSADDKCESPDERDKIFTYLAFNKNGSITCFRATVYNVDGRSPSAVIPDYDYAKGPYSAWSESRWKTDSFKLSIFLVQDSVPQGMVLLAGLLMFLSSLIIVGITYKKSDILFNTGDIL